MLIVLVVSPGANSIEPDVDVKSASAVAVPGAVAKSTSMTRLLGAESVTVKSAVAEAFCEVGSAAVTSLIERDGAASSSVIVPTAWPSPTIAFCRLARVTRKVSASSSMLSGTVLMAIVLVVSPGAKVTVPLAGT